MIRTKKSVVLAMLLWPLLMLRHVLFVLTVFSLNNFSVAEPCQNYTCDSLAVRACLDSNGFDSIFVQNISAKNSVGRIWRLRFGPVGTPLEKKMKFLPAVIGNLSALTNLDLADNQLTDLPHEFENLSALSGLGLSKNQFATLPPEILNLSGLKNLSFSNNQLTSLPPELGNLSGLIHLDLSRNQLTSLPPELGNLNSLTHLTLSNNKLVSLPPEIGKLSALTHLDLGYNRLTTLLPEIGNLSALTGLGLSKNQLTSLAKEIGKLSALTKFSLQNNQLTSLPSDIGNLSALTSLDLSLNQLTSLPVEIGNLSNLRSLYLYRNQLTNLPPEIGNLKTLELFYLNNNQLRILPPEIVKLPDSVSLFLSDNQLCDISVSTKEWIYKTQLVTPGTHPSWHTTQYSDSAHTILCKVTVGLESKMFLGERRIGFSIFPNPFNQSTTIHFSSPTFSNPTLSIFNPQGHLINTIQSGARSAGNFLVTWDGKDNQGRNVASGTYLVRLKAGDKTVTRRINLVR